MKVSRKEYLLLGLFYLIAHGGILLIPNAIYWDDWTLYRIDSSVILGGFKQAGSMFNVGGYLHVAMLAIGPWSYKALTFMLMLASGFLLNSIIKRHAGISTETRLFIVLLFLVLPVNIARVALIDFPYTLCYFLFFAAWVLMERYRVAALALFFFSFNTNSLLVFYALPMLDLLYRGGAFRSVKQFFSSLLRKLDYIFVPLVYWYIKTVCYAPSGEYAGYNSSENFSWANLSTSIQNQWNEFYYFVVPWYLAGTGIYIVLSVALLCWFVFLTRRKWEAANKLSVDIRLVSIGVFTVVLASIPYWLLGHNPTFLEWLDWTRYLAGKGGYVASTVAFLCLLIFLTRRKLGETNKLLGEVGLVLIGVLAFILASVPYGLLGHNPTFLDWTSRHQLLLPLGGAFFLVGVIRLLGNRFGIFVLSVVVAFSIVVNVKNYMGLYVDWEKQKQLVELFRADPRIKSAGLIGFEDETDSLNAIRRRYRDYEWSGLLKLAFGDELRFGTNRSSVADIAKLDQGNPIFSARYNAANYTNDGVRESLFIKIDYADIAEAGSYTGYWPRLFKLKLVVTEVDAK